MSDWQTVQLSDVVELRRGFDLPHRLRKAGPYPVLSAGETSGWHDVPAVKGPGIVVGRATNLGQPTWCTSDFWPLNTTLYVTDFRGNVPRWIFHLFECIDFSGYDSGSVQPMLNRNYISQVPVRVPPLREQQAIAEVLGALDDKIAANRSIARTSAGLARLIFAQAITSADVTETPFKEIASVGGGGTPQTSALDYWGADILWATPTDITGLPGPYLESTERTITHAGLEACSSPLYPAGSILMTSRATIGAFAIAEQPTAVNQGFIVVNPTDNTTRWWTFHDMESRVDEFVSHANGATFLELSRGRFRELPARIANQETMRAFSDRASSLHGVARQALRESATLASLRDTLLPALMSGKLRVRGAEKQVEAVV